MTEETEVKLGRPRKELPEDAAEQLEKLAPYLSRDMIADYMGLHRDTLRARMQENPDLEAAYARGKSKAIAAIAGGLIQKAREGDTASTIFYLKTQAGWRETQQIDHTSSDGTMTPQVTTFALPDNGRNDREEPETSG